MKRTLPGVVVAALLTVAAAAAAFYIESRPGGAPSQTTMAGSMFVSDAGKSHGGFEYTATWNASLQASGSTGNLTFVLQVGLGDALTKYIIPPKSVAKIRDQLDLVGVDERRLFPDLDGVAAAIRRYYA